MARVAGKQDQGLHTAFDGWSDQYSEDSRLPVMYTVVNDATGLSPCQRELGIYDILFFSNAANRRDSGALPPCTNRKSVRFERSGSINSSSCLTGRTGVSRPETPRSVQFYHDHSQFQALKRTSRVTRRESWAFALLRGFTSQYQNVTSHSSAITAVIFVRLPVSLLDFFFANKGIFQAIF